MSWVGRYIEGLEWSATVFKENLLSLTVVFVGALFVGAMALFLVVDRPQVMINQIQRFNLAMATFIVGLVFVALPLIYWAREIENRD